MHSITCRLISVSVTKSPLAFIINFIITSGKKYGQVKVMKCPPYSSPERCINSNVNPNLKNDPNTKANSKVTPWFKLRLDGTLRDN